jgi:hypothetical protein
MKMPTQSRRPPVERVQRGSAILSSLSEGGISMSGCDKWKKIRCTGKVGLCIQQCGFPPSPTCLVCLGSLGDCCDCVPQEYRHLCT